MNTHITGIHAVQGATEAVSECAFFDMDTDTPSTQSLIPWEWENLPWV